MNTIKGITTTQLYCLFSTLNGGKKQIIKQFINILTKIIFFLSCLLNIFSFLSCLLESFSFLGSLSESFKKLKFLGFTTTNLIIDFFEGFQSVFTLISTIGWLVGFFTDEQTVGFGVSGIIDWIVCCKCGCAWTIYCLS